MICGVRRRLETLIINSLINLFGIQNEAKFSVGPLPGCAGPMASQKEDAVVEHVYCRGAVTELLKYGHKDLHTITKNLNSPQVLFLIIPGNPGIVGFYKTFMWTLYQAFNQRYPVWAVSHAGHCAPPDTMDMVEDASAAESEDVFGLNGQIEHKMGFLLEHIPQDTRLILIGHSIGCYIILEMMKRDPALKVMKSVLLFPTIERMSSSPQGKVMTPVLCHLRYIAYLPIFLLSLLPEKLKAGMVQLVLRNMRSLDTSCVSATLSLINVDCAANAMYMGSQEMRMVLDRDNMTIQRQLDKISDVPKWPKGLNDLTIIRSLLRKTLKNVRSE